MTMMKMKMMTISEPLIRRGSIDDVPAIKEVEDKSFGPHAYDYPSIKYMVGVANAETVVYTVQGKIVGYASTYFRKNSRIAHLESIAVDPDYQGMGIGKIIMKQVEDISIKRNCSKIILETFERNLSALNLYLGMGYIKTGMVIDYYNVPYDGSRNAIKLEKELSRS